MASSARTFFGSDSRRSSVCAWPVTIISRLLKSCATPPVKLAERLHFLRLRELRLRALERFLGVVPLGDVARDLGKADQPAVLSRMASMTTLAQNCEPSLRTR